MNILIILLVIQTAISFYCIVKLISKNKTLSKERELLLEERIKRSEANQRGIKLAEEAEKGFYELQNEVDTCNKNFENLKLTYTTSKESYENCFKTCEEFLEWSKEFISVAKELKEENLKLRNIVAELNNQLNNEKSEQQN